jgi:TonB family protein
MFETSVVQARAKAAARRPLLFSLSIGAHAAAVIGVVTMSVAGVTLPDRAPNQLRVPVFFHLPPMLGDGGTPKRSPAGAPPPPQKRPAAPSTAVAPRTLPEHVAEVASTQSTSSDTGPATGDSTNTGPAGTPGVPWGTKDGVIPDGPPATSDEPAKIYQLSGDVKAPVVLHRVMPPYPEIARRMGLNGFVIVECIIDRSGQVRDARVVRSSFAAFEQPALDAIHQWKFAPGSLNGAPVNVQFDLTVTFQVR